MMSSSGWKRVITALIGAPLLLGTLWIGGWLFALVIAGITVAAQIELYRMMARQRSWFTTSLEALAVIALVLVPMDLRFGGLAVLSLLASLALTLRGSGESLMREASGVVFGIVYPAALLAFMVALRELPDGFTIAFLALSLVWGADSLAYYVGRLLGRHKLAPTLSPGKTWEGVGGGVLGAALVAAGFAVWSELPWSVVDWAVLALLAAMLGPTGDLFESGLKRAAKVKDSASLLPGHGGFLDRFDALAFVAPAVYLYATLVI